MSIEIEGPYSFKDVDGLVAPVYIYEPGGKKKTVGKVAVKVQGGMTFEVSLVEEHKDVKSASFEVPMRFAAFNRPADYEPPVNWGYNCLTSGIHHGRPEALWNLPLLQATVMFEAEDLKALVVSRIHTDALIFVHRGETDHAITTQAWADRIKEFAEEKYDSLLEAKVHEILAYYKSPMSRRDQKGVVGRVMDNRLNPHYNPLHGHDSINMLCRILGQSSAYEATSVSE